MIRLLRPALAGAMVLAMVGLTRADSVYYLDPATKKPTEYRKIIIEEEGPGGIKIRMKENKKDVVKQIQAKDILELVYETPTVDRVTFRTPFNKENSAKGAAKAKRAKLLDEAMDGYTKLADLLRDRPAGRRYIQFKIAEVLVLQAEDDPTKTDAAIKMLTDLKKDSASSWTITSLLKTLARLQEETGKTDEARKTYEELADLPDVPRELKLESDILVGRLLLRGSKYADAEKRLEKLAGTLSAADAQRPLVLAYLAESRIGQNKLDTVEKDLREVIRGTSENRARGAAYNLLGDYYSRKGQAEEAFWNYLRVDAMYNEDVEEQAKALYRLSILFDKVKKDPIRGKECVNRLQDKRFAGTTYQKLAKPTETKEK
jgi:hypothetical protein